MSDKFGVVNISSMPSLDVEVGDWVASIFSGWVRVVVVTKSKIVTSDKMEYLHTGQLDKSDFACSLFTDPPKDLGFEPKPEKKLKVKEQKELVLQLLDDGYLPETTGVFWTCEDGEDGWDKPDFPSYLFKYCGQYQSAEFNWEPQWLQGG
jgi:hypothetical protein